MQLQNVAKPFGEVNVYKQKDGVINIVATILREPDFELARMGLALDGSASMKTIYGSGGGIFTSDNLVEPVARTMVKFLTNYSHTGKVNVIYWACNPDGSKIEELGEFDSERIQNTAITGPKKLPWGRGTKLLPSVKYFVEKFKGESELGDIKKPAGFCVFVTDGILEDLADVKQYCIQYAQEISQGKKPFMKFFLIGVGDEVDERQMNSLDDMFENNPIKDTGGQNIDLWDHQLASDMNQLEQVFKEMVSEDMIVIGSGRILNQAEKNCHEYSDGVPALLKFTLPPGSTSFTLESPKGSFTQDISEAL